MNVHCPDSRAEAIRAHPEAFFVEVYNEAVQGQVGLSDRCWDRGVLRTGHATLGDLMEPRRLPTGGAP